jgi:hypothetical protein
MSDHGSLLNLGGPQELAHNLMFSRTAGHPDLLGDDPTPVNLFPMLFNTYLGTDLPIRADHSYLPVGRDELVEVDPARGQTIRTNGIGTMKRDR